ncbi:hypothetical protein A8709_29475 [Paenibacillus pectinilyticus]|uniref:DUF309 domain-containing protein n=1 Tax=Paenibacillus pectinilyticus TaxID=512399 RepID=A0A1C0ZV59_9BACL|nr:DUF309 domain-containing protein [Paenibacillus pectinilyticus]OCT11990.1 hypothetical protein A8709_29475 [Paenibacillus pectinilyticus]
MHGYDRLYVAFLYYFNDQRDYFECHEVMEELWLEEGRNPLYQGLLQIAVGLYHHGNGNPSGSIKLFTAGLEKLAPYPERILGINLGRLVKDSEVYVGKLLNLAEAPFLPYDLDIEIVEQELMDLLDELRLDPPQVEEHS